MPSQCYPLYQYPLTRFSSPRRPPVPPERHSRELPPGLLSIPPSGPDPSQAGVPSTSSPAAETRLPSLLRGEPQVPERRPLPVPSLTKKPLPPQTRFTSPVPTQSPPLPCSSWTGGLGCRTSCPSSTQSLSRAVAPLGCQSYLARSPRGGA